MLSTSVVVSGPDQRAGVESAEGDDRPLRAGVHNHAAGASQPRRGHAAVGLHHGYLPQHGRRGAYRTMLRVNDQRLGQIPLWDTLLTERAAVIYARFLQGVRLGHVAWPPAGAGQGQPVAEDAESQPGNIFMRLALQNTTSRPINVRC